MTPDDWKLVKSVLDRAMERPPAERGRWLDLELDGEPELRAEVESLLAAYDAGRTLLEPAVPADGSGTATGTVGGHRPGDRIGPYRLVREIGRGGMGVVYVAERDDGSFEQTVALKLVQTGLDPAEMQRRFLQERQILARLEHPNVARLLDGGRTEQGLHFLAMEYVEGEPIDHYCAEHGLGLDARLDLFLSICSAVDYAHRNLVVHRDLKPGNVLVTRDGTPKLLDFGIAKLLQDGAGGAAATRVGLRVMTPEYASPEQMRGDPVTTASDVYSLGVLLYQLLTGRPPHELKGRPLPEVARVVCEEPVRPPSTAVRPGSRDAGGEVWRRPRRLRGDLDAIVLQALRKQPAERYATVEQLAADLRRLREGRPVQARRGSVAYRASKFVGRHRFGVAVVAAFALLLVLFVLSLTRQITRTTKALERAESEAAKAEAVQAFLEETLEAADPRSNEGRDLTVQEALDRAAERLDTSFREQPEIEAAVLNLVGRLYSRMGRYDEAEPLLRTALATRRGLDASSPESDDLAESLVDLGALLGRTARSAEADSLLREALARRQRSLGADHPAVAETLGLLARVASDGGDYRRAAELERRAVDVYRAAPDSGSQLVQALTSLGDFERGAGDLEAAEAALEDAVARLDVLEATGEPVAALRAEVAMDLGDVYEAQARPAEAERRFVEAAEALAEVYGEDHHWRAQALVRIGTVRARLAEFDAGEAALLEGIEILRRQLDADHPDVALSLNNLAFLYGEKGDLERAEETLLSVVEILRRNIPGHPELGVVLRNLGQVELRQGRVDDARVHLDEALSIHLERLGEEHPYSAQSAMAQAWAIGEGGDWRRAESLLREALAGLEAAYGADHPRTAEARSLLGLSLLRLGRRDEAEPLLAASLPVLVEAHGEGNHRVVRTRRALEESR